MENKTKILAKLSKIMGEIGIIEKDKKNTFQNYEYLSEAAIKRAIQPLLVKHGVILMPTILSKKSTTTEKMKDGKPNGKETFVELELCLAFFDVESGEMISATITGDGTDSGDKGVFKAITGALKYALTTVFLIPTETDPENEEKAAAKVESKPKTVKVGVSEVPVDDAF